MGKFHRYWIAYRNGGKGNFQIVEPPQYGWTADPFLVEYRGDIYLFAEIFLYKSERNGKIGYCKYENGGFGDWQISMDKHWHLSYPNVFVHNDRLYMIPESYQLEEVAVYELVEFPDRWRKVKTLIDNVEYCDSTFLTYDNKCYMFTYERHKDKNKDKEIIYQMIDGELGEKHIVSTSQEGARSAGNIIVEGDKYIRVAQNGVPEYGSGMIFYEIDSVWPNYKEHEIRRYTPGDYNPEWAGKYIGCHTYNRLGDLEVIDLIGMVDDKAEEEAITHTQKVFVNKYR